MCTLSKSQSNEIVYVEMINKSIIEIQKKARDLRSKELGLEVLDLEVHLQAFAVGDLQREALAACCVAWRSIEKRKYGRFFT
jgi:hypothetical protein